MRARSGLALTSPESHVHHSETLRPCDILAALKAQLPKQRFGSEIIAGDVVLIKPRGGEAAFMVELVESSVTGTKVHITHE